VTAIAILVAFLAGAMAGVAVLMRVGMASEKPARPLVGESPARSALATRCVVGLFVLTPRSVGQADRSADQPDAGQRQLPPAAEPRR
jgi:uncharacterized membrane protein